MSALFRYVRRAIALPLRMLPAGLSVPILSGPLRTYRWTIGAGRHSYWLGTYECAMQQSLQSLIRPGDCVLDIGANVGFFTLLASRLTGPQGTVVAFEPLPSNVRILRRHLQLNRVRNVSVVEAAVGDRIGVVGFDESHNASMGHISATGTLNVQLVTLDSLIANGVLSVPNVLKIDVEGAEAGLLRGASRLLCDHHPAILFAGHSTKIQEECVAILTSHGYKVTVQKDGTGDGMYESAAVYETNVSQS